METRPLSNAPAQMQEWSRWVDLQISELGEGAIPVIKAQMDRIAANDLRYQQNMATLTFQLKYIIDKVQASADYAAFKVEMDKITNLGEIVAEPPAEPVVKTVKINASGSATWNQYGLITGTGEYTNANMLYQDGRDSPKTVGSFWFSSADLAQLTAPGVTIDSATLYVKNKHFYYNAGGTGYFAPHAFQNKTKPTSSANGFNQTFEYGQGKTITLSPTIISGLRAGTVKGFSVGVAAPSTTASYGYFYGASYSSRPYLTVTYTIS
jgi:hypothetical protein